MSEARVEVVTVGPAPLDGRATQVMVPMRDGVRLATDVYLPDGTGPFPTVLVRLPYDKCGAYTFLPMLAASIVGRGYAFVAQDVRGKFRSEGEVVAFVHEVDDGYDTLEWLVAEEWSDGAVGMFGDSYYGFTQWAAVASGHPALRAIVPRVTAADLGAWLGGVTPLYGAQYLAECWTDALLHEWEIDWSRRPLASLFDPAFAAIGTRSRAFDDLVRRGTADVYGDGEAHPLDRLAIPVLHVVGWFDNIGPHHLRDFERLAADPLRADLQYLFSGAFDHENYLLAEVPVTPHPPIGELTSDPALLALQRAAIEELLPLYLDPALAFFDAFVARLPGAVPPPRARWELGHDGWRESGAWPPAEARARTLHLDAADRAALDETGGALLDEPSPTGSTARWVHDPERLVPSAVANPFAFLLTYPDERLTGARSDVLTFTSAPLTTAVDLAGPVSAALEVDSDSVGANLHVRLLDVSPDGAAHAIVSGQARCAEPEPTDVYLGHTGYRVRPGHRLRLQVAASDYPLFLPDPGTGEDPWHATTTRPVAMTLRTGGEARSRLCLSVLPHAPARAVNDDAEEVGGTA